MLQSSLKQKHQCTNHRRVDYFDYQICTCLWSPKNNLLTELREFDEDILQGLFYKSFCFYLFLAHHSPKKITLTITKLMGNSGRKIIRFFQIIIRLLSFCFNLSKVIAITVGDNPSEHQGKSVLTAKSLQAIAAAESDTAFPPGQNSYLSFPFHACLPPYHRASLGLTPALQANQNIWASRGIAHPHCCNS